MVKTDKDRCCLCGKVMDNGEAVVRIAVGTKKPGKVEFKAVRVWGDCHEVCLNKALPTTRATLNELQRLSKVAVKPGSQPAKPTLVKAPKVAKIVVKKRKRAARVSASA